MQNIHTREWREEQRAAEVEERKKREQERIENKDRENIAIAKKRVSEINEADVLNKNGDPIFDIYGAVSESHPDEMVRIIRRAEELGVEVREGDGGRMAYSPGLRTGQPGQLIISKNDSIGAWLHEEQHMNDDYADGFLGFQGLFDIERRCQMEYNAYKREIDIANQAGREDIAEILRNLCKEEIEMIGGIWDEKKLR